MVGELVIAQSMVSQDLASFKNSDPRVERNIRHLDKITRELQDLSMSMRMVPVQGVFQKMARLVRDLSRKAGKEIELTIIGAETELDRNVVEAIADPLVHMVRNSIDHGIEPAEERVKARKSRVGQIELKAFHQGGNIVIQIQDDGKGLNREKILQKAIKNGIVKEGQDLSDEEIYKLIFHAGLSTAEKITDISGRGVGMDVVRKNIESLRGRVEIKSEPGRGSTFSISLPLTLAVIDGQIVSVGKEKFIIPTISLVQSIRPTKDQISTIYGKGEMIQVRGELVPMVRLGFLFGIEAKHDDPTEALVVIVADGKDRSCIMVDSLLGQQQVVIKSLGDYLGHIRGISGGAIMGDGNVSLILDILNQDNSLSEEDFKRISDVIYSHCGINLHDGKKSLVRARLAKLLRMSKHTSFKNYIDYVLSPAGRHEFSSLVDSISTNLTSFFREKNHFDFLTNIYLPQLCKEKEGSSQQKIRVWSAGCSSGEEPYSLAITLLEYFGDQGQWDIKILATDVSTRMLEKAQMGTYDKERIAPLSQEQMRRFLIANRIEGYKVYQVSQTLKNSIKFRYLNLMEEWPFNGTFDFIFCRNVMIYFDKSTQEKLVNRYWNHLNRGGMLFVGHSESLAGIQHKYKYVIPAAYVKA
jgi:chemotaxis methyl-accepting protein methylase/two-component sensor histidine kinase/chemotaxis signal transduction protein